MEKLNCAAEFDHQAQEELVRKPWQTPVVEELLVSESENTLTFGSADNGIYTS